jgi:hypothetical protein
MISLIGEDIQYLIRIIRYFECISRMFPVPEFAGSDYVGFNSIFCYLSGPFSAEFNLVYTGLNTIYGLEKLIKKPL